MDNEIKVRIAKQSARLFLTQMASVPVDVQLMAVEMIAKAIFATSVQEPRRLEFLDKWLKQIRDGVVAITGGKKNRGKKTSH